MFLGTEKEWMTALGCLTVILISVGLVVGFLIAWMISGPSVEDICRMQGGSFNGGVCYVEKTE